LPSHELILQFIQYACTLVQLPVNDTGHVGDAYKCMTQFTAVGNRAAREQNYSRAITTQKEIFKNTFTLCRNLKRIQ